jgi:ribose-phosphate pyrophosphokinase
MKLLAGNSNRTLAAAIGDHLDLPLTKAQVRRFADNEVFVTIEENVRGEDVFVIQSTSYPANDNLMELLICCDALQRASARRITAVMPYFGYARQDRKTGGRTPISAKLVANLITRAGADRVLTLDLHAGQIQGFFDIPTDNLLPVPLIAQDIRESYGRSANVMNLIGDVSGRNCIMFDDIVDSAGTLCNAAEALVAHGAAGVSAYITHGVLSGAASERVSKSVLKELVVTDTIESSDVVRGCTKIRQVTVAPLIGEAIRRIANEESVSKLFD